MLSSKAAFITALDEAFEAVADPENAVFQKAYMRDQFEFYGIKTELRRTVMSELFHQHKLEDFATVKKIVKELWKRPQREYQYIAQELLLYYKKLWPESVVDILVHCIINKSWWDTVDYLSSHGAGLYFQKFPAKQKSITKAWNRSNNMWLNRSSLLFQLKYKGKTDTAILAEYIRNLSGSKEFFIQKAIGWILREYSKHDPGWVKAFIDSNQLAPLSIREGSKYL